MSGVDPGGTHEAGRIRRLDDECVGQRVVIVVGAGGHGERHAVASRDEPEDGVDVMRDAAMPITTIG